MSDAIDGSPTNAIQPAGYELTRFNATRHGVLSRYTVLPWEDRSEYQALLDALVAEHAPQGPTEEHLVEELAGVMWRKRRLNLAETAAFGQEDDPTGALRVHTMRLEPLARYEVHLDRKLERMLAMLIRLRERRPPSAR